MIQILLLEQVLCVFSCPGEKEHSVVTTGKIGGEEINVKMKSLSLKQN